MRPKLMGIATFAVGTALLVTPPALSEELDAKAKSDLATAELARLKTMQEMITASKSSVEGKATATDLDAGAEVLRMQHITEAEAARRLVAEIGDGNGQSIVVAFGASPPSVAHYLAMKHGVDELQRNTDETLRMARQVFDKPASSRRPKVGSVRGSNLFAMVESNSVAQLGDIPDIGLGLSAITTVISLLRVDTDIKGKTLQSRPAVLGPLVSSELTSKGWSVEIPDFIATRTDYANGIVQGFKGDRAALSKYYALYLARVQVAPEGKAEKLPEDVRIVGKALETTLGDHRQLVVGLFSPVDGVLPAAVLEEEKRLAELLPSSALLVVNGNDVALTSMTQKGMLTGLFGSVPAHASATSVLTFTLVRGGRPQFGSVAYQTPMVRVRQIAGWADKADANRQARRPRQGLEENSGVAATADH